MDLWKNKKCSHWIIDLADFYFRSIILGQRMPLFASFKLAMRGNKIGLFGVWTLGGLFFLNMTEVFFYGVEFLYLLVFIMTLVAMQQKSIDSKGWLQHKMLVIRLF